MPTDRNHRMIELIRVGRNYTRADGQRVNAVDDVSLIVPEGEFVCLIGPSGCPKSTLLQMVGLDTPSSGAIVVDGKEIDGPGRERGMVFQRDSVHGWALSTMLNMGSSAGAPVQPPAVVPGWLAFWPPAEPGSVWLN
jgi:NitT/TauT family transport system ATP-binding protein